MRMGASSTQDSLPSETLLSYIIQSDDFNTLDYVLSIFFFFVLAEFFWQKERPDIDFSF